MTATAKAPLLLVNGYAATGADWDPTFLAELGRAHQVICPDNRGLGGPPLGDGELTIDLMASDLEAFLDGRGIERLPVVGWSMGGFIAQRLAERSPGRVAALALIATDPGGPAAVEAAPEIWSRLVDHSGTPREQATRLLALLFPPPLAAEIDRQFGDAVAAARARLPGAVLSAQEAAMEAWHREERPPVGAGRGRRRWSSTVRRTTSSRPPTRSCCGPAGRGRDWRPRGMRARGDGAGAAAGRRRDSRLSLIRSRPAGVLTSNPAKGAPMPNIGPLEICVVLIIALVVFGPKRLPELGKSLGKGIAEFKGTIGGETRSDRPAAIESSTATAAPTRVPEDAAVKTQA